MIYINVHRISEASAHNEETYSVVKLKIEDGMFPNIAMFFAPEQAEAIAQAINAAITKGRR